MRGCMWYREAKVSWARPYGRGKAWFGERAPITKAGVLMRAVGL